MSEKKREVLFVDYDGTLVDTETPYWEEWTQKCASLGVDIKPRQWARLMMGNHCPSVLLASFGIHLAKTDIKRVNTVVFDRIHASGMMPGALELIEAHKQRGCVVALPTNALDLKWIELTKPKEFDLEWFDHIEFDVGKPRHDTHAAILKAVGVSGRDAWGVEDTVWGIQALRGAGVSALFVPSGPYKHENPDGVVRLDSLVGVTPEFLADMSSTQITAAPQLAMQ